MYIYARSINSRDYIGHSSSFLVLYLSYAPPVFEYGTSAFFRWFRSQNRSSHATGRSKNASGPGCIPFLGAPQAPGDKPNPSEEG